VAFAGDASAAERSAEGLTAGGAEPAVGTARALRAVAGGAPAGVRTAVGDGGGAGGATSSSSAGAMGAGLADDSRGDGDDASGRTGSAGARAESVCVTL
jgi:hypothetical protein